MKTQIKINRTPLIKWSGSKRKQAPYIVSQFPKEIDTYYEPFVGGGSVMRELLNQIALGNIKCNKIICSDLNQDLINVWNLFKNEDTRKELFDYYVKMHYQLKERSLIKDGEQCTNEHIRNCQTLYYEMRDKYNKMIDDNDQSNERAMLFYWITRTCFNGLIRYNPKTNHFNSPFHVGGQFGIGLNELQEVFNTWASIMNNVNIEFICGSYDDIIKDAKNGDVVYMDPPYESMKGMYFCTDFDAEYMYDVIENISKNGAKVLLSYDGFSGDDNRTSNVRKWYVRHEYVNNGQSNFKKMKSNSAGMSNNDIVRESLYINF